jgi:hypothetical protein
VMKTFIITVEGCVSHDGIETDVPVQSDYEMTVKEYILLDRNSKLKRTLQCDICGSYVISAREFLNALEKLSDYAEVGAFAGELSSLLTESTLSLNWDDKRWHDYMEGKFKLQRLLYHADGSEATDAEGHFLCLKYDECSFVFDFECSCFPMMRGEQ